MLAEDAGSSATDAGFEVEVRGMDEIDVDEMCEVERLLTTAARGATVNNRTTHKTSSMRFQKPTQMPLPA